MFLPIVTDCIQSCKSKKMWMIRSVRSSEGKIIFCIFENISWVEEYLAYLTYFGIFFVNCEK